MGCISCNGAARGAAEAAGMKKARRPGGQRALDYPPGCRRAGEWVPGSGVLGQRLAHLLHGRHLDLADALGA
ncbi:hypothetical protein, partial [Pulveribacter sp.]|uniref:hypothetical protein n=1 Tax=Pulveribacter sp. TaxID=2678893 RepID=UPI0028A66DC1